jgi:hypothetical protein
MAEIILLGLILTVVGANLPMLVVVGMLACAAGLLSGARGQRGKT